MRYTTKMQIKIHQVNNTRIAEVVSDGIVISNIEEGTDLLGNLYYQDFDKVILYEKNIVPSFFSLKTGVAGEILQKFSNYRVKLAIVGDFDVVESNSLRDFIFESNKTGQVYFISSVKEAIELLSKT